MNRRGQEKRRQWGLGDRRGWERKEERREGGREEGEIGSKGRMMKGDGGAGHKRRQDKTKARVKTNSETDRWLEEMGNFGEICKFCCHQRQHLLSFFAER